MIKRRTQDNQNYAHSNFKNALIWISIALILFPVVKFMAAM